MMQKLRIFVVSNAANALSRGVYRNECFSSIASPATVRLTLIDPNRSLSNVSGGGKPRVLVVDDQEALRTLLSRLLEREGFDPIQAADGEQAVEAFKSQSPLVVVSDIMMPRMDGLALLTEIKRIDRNAIVILMTGQGNEDVLLRALRGGASNFFKKPFNVRELIDEIRKVVEFRIEAARSTLFSPLLVEETKSFVLPRADSPYFPIINQITLQLPCLMPEEEILNLKIGIEEMVTNALEHGNLGISFEEKSKAIEDGRLPQLIAERGMRSDAEGRKVYISSHLSPYLFEISIRDEGRGFDWRALPSVAPENLLSFNGRGIFLTKIYFDEVLYSQSGNEVTLRKFKP
jgi:CheY-like chemotaxis protein/anti-sigma regulatory factor (Ser/Thr protein kinase)